MNSINSLTAIGPLQALLEDPEVTEILVDAPDRVTIEREGKVEKTGITFASDEALRATIDEVLALGGAAFGAGQTVCETRLADKSRVVAVLPPTAVNGPCLVIRKFSKHLLTVQQIIEYRSVTEEMMALLRSAITHCLNILVAGGTGSGKTTLLNILTGEIPANERVIIVEETPEIQSRAAWQVCLSSEGVEGLTYSDLILTASKMRPDRLVFGELRGTETIRVLQIMNNGHDGCLTTIHASNAEDALNRLEVFCLMSNLGLGLNEIRNLIASSFQLIVVPNRLPNGSRKVTEVVEMRGLDQDRYILQPLMRYNPEIDQFETMPVKPGWDTNLK